MNEVGCKVLLSNFDGAYNDPATTAGAISTKSAAVAVNKSAHPFVLRLDKFPPDIRDYPQGLDCKL